ncbi:unnamed protein product [Protopolystoma xenopodis]|uniref:PNPLA domain-containing protein n=1 Tax=Protopolystoma xenopodis TaxID=117903 RepID=A0A3S5ABJ5_9PLAT|nr:unnamed protein product [Protopolystoma xenopodis]
MSYPMLLPPLCDPEDGHLLMDGAFVNNVPGRNERRRRSFVCLNVRFNERESIIKMSTIRKQLEE